MAGDVPPSRPIAAATLTPATRLPPLPAPGTMLVPFFRAGAISLLWLSG